MWLIRQGGEPPRGLKTTVTVRSTSTFLPDQALRRLADLVEMAHLRVLSLHYVHPTMFSLNNHRPELHRNR